MNDKFTDFINSKKCDEYFSDFYGNNEKINQLQKKRYLSAANQFNKLFGDKDFSLFNTPGRTEIIGNHTDHNLGKVIAGSITLDSIAAAAPNNSNKIKIYSANYKKFFEVNINNIEPVNKEKGTTESLIRGVAAGFIKNKYKTSGFNAFIDSNVLPGSGLSSSACFEVLTGTIINGLFNNQKATNVEIAKIGQFAENNYMKKPSGLMDQIACAYGGIVKIDFANKEKPIIKKINFNLSDYNYSLIIIDTGANHENLTPHYAAIPAEMKNISSFFKKDVLRKVNYYNFMNNIKKLSSKYGDRAVLRAIHYFEENIRVDELLKSITNKNLNDFLSLINKSGNSSCNILQNCFVPEIPSEEKLLMALIITQLFLDRIKAGACRVHGGGFAGTIQVFIPTTQIENYKKTIYPVFGKNSLKILNIRNTGTVKFF